MYPPHGAANFRPPQLGAATAPGAVPMGPPGVHFPTAAYPALAAPMPPGGMMVSMQGLQGIMQQFVPQGMILQPGYAVPQQGLPQQPAVPQQSFEQSHHPQMPEHLSPGHANLEYQKGVARKLLDSLDDDSLWRLARMLKERGLWHPPFQGINFDNRTVSGYPGAAVAGNSPLPPGNFGQQPMGMGPLAASSAPPPPPHGAAAAARASGPPPVEISLATATTPVGAALAQAGSSSAARPQPSQREQPPPQASASASGRGRKAAAQPEPERAAPGGKAPATPTGDSAEADGGSGDDDDNTQGSTGDSTATTLILRNLPSDFDQPACQAWVDKAFKGNYNFLLWFPAKKTSRLNNCSYAFVNFNDAQHARRFRDNFHLHRFSHECADGSGKHQWPLSVAVAKVQGFAENYIRFHHLTEKSNTLCKPFFSEEAMNGLTEEERAAAKKAEESGADGETTTLVVRNLPPSIDSQDVARTWLDKAGYWGKYNFFLYIPPKKRKIDGGQVALHGLAYSFVNFKTPGSAKACMEKLDGMQVGGGQASSGENGGPDDAPALSVVVARIQGLEECWNHFRGIKDSGRLEPWVDSAEEVARNSTPFPGNTGFQ